MRGTIDLKILPARQVECADMKHCTKCKTDKPSDAFHKDAGRWSGLQSWCIRCQRLYEHAWEAEAKSKSSYELMLKRVYARGL